MTKPGFRRSGVRRGIRGFGATEPSVEGSPFSHAQIFHLMKTEFARARRHRYPLACLVLEVDRLQPLVEIHGLELRDAVQQELGRMVTEKTRGHDHVGTVRANRYLLILPHAGTADALAVAERIRAGFDDLEIESQGAHVPLTLSVGAASSEDQETLFFDTMVSQAEVALEWAIREGGGRSVLFRKERFLAEGPSGDVSFPERTDVERHEDPAGRRRKDDRDHPH